MPDSRFAGLSPPEYPIPIHQARLTLEAPRAFLPRQRLLELLDCGPRPRLVVLHAPAGSGKSTLLYQLLDPPVTPVVYYRLGRTDADLPQFVSYLLAGIRRHRPDFGERTRSYLAEIQHRNSISRAAGDLFIHEIGLLPEGPLWVVLDDYQKVDDSPEVVALVGELLEVLPTGARLVIASRIAPSLPLSRWRVQGDLLEIGPADLAFTWAETQEYFKEAAGVDLSDSCLSAIHSATEGWAAGLALAAQIAQSHSIKDAVRLVQGVTSTGSPIHDYLAEQVYASLAPDVKLFLRRTSILSVMTPEICDELPGIARSAQLITDLSRAGMYLLPADASGYSYRYHQLFREFLLAKLREEELPETIHQLRETAGQAAEDRHLWDEAIHQYISAGDAAAAVQLVVRFGEQAIESGQLHRVSRWLQELPSEVVEGRAGLLALRGLISLRLGETTVALDVFSRCKLLLSAGTPADGNRVGENGSLDLREDAEAKRVEVMVARHAGLAHYREGSYAQSISMLEEALDRGVEDPVAAIDLQRLLGVAYRGAGELDEAEQHARDALQILEQVSPQSKSAWTGRVALLRNLARIKMCQGRLDKAAELCRTAVRLCETDEVNEFRRMRSFTMLGAVLATRGDFQDALEAMEAARAKGADFYPPERKWIEGYLGNIHRDIGDLDRADRHYQEAGEQFVPEFAFLLLRKGLIDRSMRLAEGALSSRRSRESPPEKARAQVPFGLGLAALGLVEQAVRMVEEAAEVLRRHNYGQRYASTSLRLSALWRELGDREKQHRWLERWLRTARECSLYHFHWWDGDVVSDALTEALSQGIEPEFATRLAVQRLPAQGLQGLKGYAEGVTPLFAGGGFQSLIESCRDPLIRAAILDELESGRITGEQLTRLRDRSLTWTEILVFLHYYVKAGHEAVQGESSLRAHVANRLCLSQNTVKCHVGSIRRKLGICHRIGTVGLLAQATEKGVTSILRV